MLIIALIGLKKSGKTTTAQHLITEFGKRGKKVGAIKFMPNSVFTLDTKGKDTWRHRRSGAEFVISLSKNEIAFIGNKNGHATLDDAMDLIPVDTDVLICEGLNEERDDIKRILIAKDPKDLEDAIRIRGIEGGVSAISGIISNSDWKHPEIPVYNATEEIELSDLVDMLYQ